MASTGKNTARLHLMVLAFFVFMTLVLTFPLIMQFADHVPGTTTWSMDEYGYVWNNWWFKHAVFDLGTNPFQTDYIFYPIGISLVLYTFTLLHVLLGLPIQFLFGLVPAANSEVVFSFVVSGYGAFLLARYLTRETPGLSRDVACIVAGSVFAFSSNRFVYLALGHQNVIATEWIPFYTLYILKTLRSPRISNALLAGLFAALAMYVETTDGVLLFLLTLGLIAFGGRSIKSIGVLTRLSIAGITAAVLYSPLLVPTIQEIMNSGYSMPGWGHSEKLLVDLMGLLTPTSLHPLNRNWVDELDQVRQGTARFVDVNTVFLGYITLALALVGTAKYWNSLRAWAANAVIFIVLSLGPLLHINGQSTFDLDGLPVSIPLPFLLLHYVPLLKENRVPNRFSILIMLSLAVLAGFAAMWLMEVGRKLWRDNRRAVVSSVLGSVLLVLVVFEHAALPIPLTDARIPEVYSLIARDPGDYAILSLPLGWRNSFGQLGAEDTRTQYYQSAHSRFLFSGNIQRNPPSVFGYFDRIPFFHSLAELEFYQTIADEDIERDRSTAGEILSFFNVRYIVVHPSIPGRPPYSDTRGAVIEYIQRVLPLADKVYDRDGTVAFWVEWMPISKKLEIPFGSKDAYIYQAEGWDRNEIIADQAANWANGKRARVLFSAQEPGDRQVTIRALAFLYPNAPKQTMTVSVGGEQVQQFQLQPSWKDYLVQIPARLVRLGVNAIELDFAYAVRPHDVLPPLFAVGTTEIVSPVDIVVYSREYGSIKINNQETSPLGRGYNLVAIDKQGRVISTDVFNTADDRSESAVMADWIAKLPDGSIVAVSSQENAAASLGERAIAALRSLGSQVDLRAHPERSHAMIGVKGARPGTAAESSQGDGSFISVGHSPDERTLAAAVSFIVIESK